MCISLFLICLFASSIGAVVGAGGGVIIKPVLDALELLPVRSVSFLSSCTVFCMAVVSLIRTRRSGGQLQLRTSTPLAIGAALGGLLGKALFELAKVLFSDERLLGCTQALCLAGLTALVLVYIRRKDTLRSFHLKSPFLSLLAGAALGTISSFLGVGGGPYNVAVLFLLFSMEAKEAAKNSIYIILFSQSVNILSTALTGTLPPFTWEQLVSMAAGGVGGALLGAEITKRLQSAGVEGILKALCGAILLINLFNALKFSGIL